MLGDTFFLFDLLTPKPILEGEELSKNIVSQMQCFTLGVNKEKKILITKPLRNTLLQALKRLKTFSLGRRVRGKVKHELQIRSSNPQVTSSNP